MKQKNNLSAKNKARAQNIVRILKKAYPNAHIALKFSNSWELLVAVILSAQCTDKKVNEITERLFKKYPALDDYITADPKEFERDIHAAGFYRAKTKSILTTAKLVKEKFGGKRLSRNSWPYFPKKIGLPRRIFS